MEGALPMTSPTTPQDMLTEAELDALDHVALEYLSEDGFTIGYEEWLRVSKAARAHLSAGGWQQHTSFDDGIITVQVVGRDKCGVAFLISENETEVCLAWPGRYYSVGGHRFESPKEFYEAFLPPTPSGEEQKEDEDGAGNSSRGSNSPNPVRLSDGLDRGPQIGAEPPTYLMRERVKGYNSEARVAPSPGEGGEACRPVDGGQWCITHKRYLSICNLKKRRLACDPSPSPQGNVAPDLSRREGVKCEPSGDPRKAEDWKNGLKPQGGDIEGLLANWRRAVEVGSERRMSEVGDTLVAALFAKQETSRYHFELSQQRAAELTAAREQIERLRTVLDHMWTMGVSPEYAEMIRAALSTTRQGERR